jgi:protein-tyrosine phosphatase
MHVENAFEKKGVKYLNIKIDDTPKYKISKYFKKTYEFIEGALTNSPEEKTIENEIESLTNLMKNLTIIEEVSTSIKEWNEINKNENNNSSPITSSIDLNDLFEKISNWTLKNKILQILFKNYYQNENDNRILIHCSLGVSRSPTLVIMYVMRKFRIKFEEAFSFIRFQRYCSNPICAFVCELEKFENNNFQFGDCKEDEQGKETNLTKKDSNKDFEKNSCDENIDSQVDNTEFKLFCFNEYYDSYLDDEKKT